LDRVFSCFGRFLFSRPFSRFFGRRRFLFFLFVSWAFTVLGPASLVLTSLFVVPTATAVVFSQVDLGGPPHQNILLTQKLVFEGTPSP